MRISDWSADVCSSDRSSRQRRGQEGARALALAALEVAIAGRDRELPRADQIAVHGDAHGTAGHAPLGAGRAHDRVDAFVFGLAPDLFGTGNDQHAYARLTAPAPPDPRGQAQGAQSRTGARKSVGEGKSATVHVNL